MTAPYIQVADDKRVEVIDRLAPANIIGGRQGRDLVT